MKQYTYKRKIIRRNENILCALLLCERSIGIAAYYIVEFIWKSKFCVKKTINTKKNCESEIYCIESMKERDSINVCVMLIDEDKWFAIGLKTKATGFLLCDIVFGKWHDGILYNTTLLVVNMHGAIGKFLLYTNIYINIEVFAVFIHCVRCTPAPSMQTQFNPHTHINTCKLFKSANEYPFYLKKLCFPT